MSAKTQIYVHAPQLVIFPMILFVYQQANG